MVKKNVLLVVCIMLIGTCMAGCCQIEEKKSQREEKKLSPNNIKKEISISDIKFVRNSAGEIDIIWSDEMNPYVDTYYLMKRRPNDGEWKQVGTLQSDRNAQKKSLKLKDILEENTIQQYEYRIDVVVTDTKKYKAVKGKSIYASNLLICLDPGHFTGKNRIINEDGSSYSEGDVTLILAKRLEEELKIDYGVTCILTRTTGDILLNGYRNEKLDENHISLRGMYAEDCNLFLSLHTNANQENVNGYATDAQPIGINKTLIFINVVAYEDDKMLKLANTIGSCLTKVNYEMGLSESEDFQAVATKEEIRGWTDEYNDQLNVLGTVCVRWGENGDYYGVLRGAAMVNVPGMIIEHGFHTVLDVRNCALNGDLLEKWADADASGIAKGYGLIQKEGE